MESDSDGEDFWNDFMALIALVQMAMAVAMRQFVIPSYLVTKNKMSSIWLKTF
jgi:hypothetical protein